MLRSDKNSESGVNELFTNMPTEPESFKDIVFMLTNKKLPAEDDALVLFYGGSLAALNQTMINMYQQYGFSQETFTSGKVLCVYGNELLKANLTTSEIDGDTVVTDSTTGLQWQKNYDVDGKHWQEALSYCENLEYAGYSDWRLPNTNELVSLFDFDREEDPYTDFPGIQSDEFFSSETSSSVEYAVSMGFSMMEGDLSSAMASRKTTIYHKVMCVRSDLPENTERQAVCTGLPANAEWNSAEPFTQTWSDGSWLPSETGVYSENADYAENCTFRCSEDYVWYDGECIVASKTVSCTGLPANAQWNGSGTITQTFSNGEYLPEVPETVYSESTGQIGRAHV